MTLNAKADAASYDYPDPEDVTVHATVNGYKLRHWYKWVGCGQSTQAVFDVSCVRKFDWYTHGDCSNWRMSAGWALSKADGQLIMNTANDNAGDETTDQTANGKKYEDATWSVSLALTWPPVITLTWDNSGQNDDEWKDDDDKTRNYAQSITAAAGDDDAYVEAVPMVTARGETEENAIRGCGDMWLMVTNLTMTKR